MTESLGRVAADSASELSELDCKLAVIGSRFNSATAPCTAAAARLWNSI